MRIPIDLTPYELITGVSSCERHHKNLNYEIPDFVFSRIIKEFERLHKNHWQVFNAFNLMTKNRDLLNEQKQKTPRKARKKYKKPFRHKK